MDNLDFHVEGVLVTHFDAERVTNILFIISLMDYPNNYVALEVLKRRMKERSSSEAARKIVMGFKL
tara:strand:+ start:1464 stop:1661 length:198 start_codon:yes stop_codon:yes gene_type:complete